MSVKSLLQIILFLLIILIIGSIYYVYFLKIPLNNKVNINTEIQLNKKEIMENEVLSKEERLALEAKIDHEECLSLGFKEETEAYGGCRLTLKSIRSQDKTTQAIRSNGLDDRFCRRWYYC